MGCSDICLWFHQAYIHTSVTRYTLSVIYEVFQSNELFRSHSNFQSVHKCNIGTEPLSAIDFQFLKRLSECRRVISHGLPNTSYLNHINIAYIVCVGLGLWCLTPLSTIFQL